MGSHIDRINIFLLFIGAAFFMPAVDGHRYDSVSIPQAQSCRQAVTSAPAPEFSINQVPSVEKTGSLHLANLFSPSFEGYSFPTASPQSPPPEPGNPPPSPPDNYPSLPSYNDASPSPESPYPSPPSPYDDTSPFPEYNGRFPPPLPTSSSPGKKKKAIVIIIVVIVIAVIVVVIGGGVFVWRYRLKRENADVKQSGASTHSASMQQNQQTPSDNRVLLPGLSPPASSPKNTSRAEATFAV
ncbi:unnamed protein product [Victoria cruziana]